MLRRYLPQTSLQEDFKKMGLSLPIQESLEEVSPEEAQALEAGTQPETQPETPVEEEIELTEEEIAEMHAIGDASSSLLERMGGHGSADRYKKKAGFIKKRRLGAAEKLANHKDYMAHRGQHVRDAQKYRSSGRGKRILARLQKYHSTHGNRKGFRVSLTTSRDERLANLAEEIRALVQENQSTVYNNVLRCFAEVALIEDLLAKSFIRYGERFEDQELTWLGQNFGAMSEESGEITESLNEDADPGIALESTFNEHVTYVEEALELYERLIKVSGDELTEEEARDIEERRSKDSTKNFLNGKRSMQTASSGATHATMGAPKGNTRSKLRRSGLYQGQTGPNATMGAPQGNRRSRLQKSGLYR